MNVVASLRRIADSLQPEKGSRLDIIHVKTPYNYKRNDLPQISQRDLPAFLEYLTTMGIGWKLANIPVVHLKPTQRELNERKIDQQAKRGVHALQAQSFLASKDLHFLDGHHRWAAMLKLDANTRVRTYIVNLSMPDLVKIGHSFEKSHVKDIAASRNRS